MSQNELYEVIIGRYLWSGDNVPAGHRPQAMTQSCRAGQPATATGRVLYNRVTMPLGRAPITLAQQS